MRLKLLSERQKQSEASYALTQNLNNIVPGDKYKDQTSGSKSKIDAMHDFIERDSDSLKISGTVDPFAAVTDGQCPKSKSSQLQRWQLRCYSQMETLKSESQSHEVDKNIRALYAIVSNSDSDTCTESDSAPIFILSDTNS